MTKIIKTMKTITICLSLVLAVSLFCPGTFASYPDLKKSRKARSVVVTVKEFIGTDKNLEKWMVDLKAFHSEYFPEIEGDLQIEDWMTKEFSNHMENKNFSDQELNIEEWMTDTLDFLYQEDLFDPEPEIEAWMGVIIQ